MLTRKLLTPFCRWQSRLRGRSELGALSDHMLTDIGLKRADIVYAVEGPNSYPCEARDERR